MLPSRSLNRLVHGLERCSTRPPCSAMCDVVMSPPGVGHLRHGNHWRVYDARHLRTTCCIMVHFMQLQEYSMQVFHIDRSRLWLRNYLTWCPQACMSHTGLRRRGQHKTDWGGLRLRLVDGCNTLPIATCFLETGQARKLQAVFESTSESGDESEVSFNM